MTDDRERIDGITRRLRQEIQQEIPEPWDPKNQDAVARLIIAKLLEEMA